MRPSPSTLIGLTLIGSAVALFLFQRTKSGADHSGSEGTAISEKARLPKKSNAEDSSTTKTWNGESKPARMIPMGSVEERYQAAQDWIRRSQREQPVEKLAVLRDARKVLLGIQEEEADWEPAMIALRLRQTDDLIVRLREEQLAESLSDNPHLPSGEK